MTKLKRQPSALHLNSDQVKALMAQMAGDSKFQMLFDRIFDAREAAIFDLCNDAVVSDLGKICTTIGEIRSYTELLSLAGAQGIAKRGDEAAE
jgi:hypothetical protein